MSVTTALRQTLEQLIDQFSLLKQILAGESDALDKRDPDALLAAAGAKHACAVQIGLLEEQLNRDLDGAPLRGLLTRLDLRERAIFEPLHTSLTTLAWECRHYNAVNGKVIHRSRQSVAELARILSGTDADSIYTARGTKRAFGALPGEGQPISLA
jgi:flagellar biosynthesis/type III secretory pathway chaperone